MRHMAQTARLACPVRGPHRRRMKSRPPKITAAQRAALRDAVAVLVSSAGLLARHIERLPREKRDAQFAVLSAAAAEVLAGVELLMEGHS